VSSLELQRAIVGRLKADATLTAIIAGRVYDQPPKGPQFPYVTLGDDQTVPDRGQGYDGSDVSLTIHTWSRAQGFPETKRMLEAIRASLTDAPLALTGHRLIDLAMAESRALRDPDGITSHGVITFTALTEPAD
jgi:hypothetical protein